MPSRAVFGKVFGVFDEEARVEKRGRFIIDPVVSEGQSPCAPEGRR